MVPSDHKPVMSLFSVSIRKVQKDKEREVFTELMRDLDRCENDSIPHLDMQVAEGGGDGAADFGALHFQVSQ
jgi:phosphatidylinositol-bisphosphatase